MALNKIAGLVTTPRWLVVALTFALAVLLAGGGWFYTSQNDRLEREAESKLDSIARLKADEISAWRSARLGDARVFMESPFIVDAVSAFIQSPGPAESVKLLKHMRLIAQNYHYLDVMLVDAGGKVLMGSSSRHSRLCEAARPALEAALRGNRAEIVDLHTSPEELPVHLGMVAPVSNPGDGSGPRTAFVLEAAASDFLYPLIDKWPEPSGSAETLLVRKDGDSVLFLNELRHQKGTALTLRIPLRETDVPAVMAVSGHEGVQIGRDYRGVEVLSAVRPVPGSPWFIVAKIDRDEALATLRVRSLLIIGIVLALVLAAFGIAGMTWQRGIKAQYRERLRADERRLEDEKRYGVILMSIGDGVVVTDREGRVTMLNPVAEQLTGWKLADACGKQLGEVFKIINEESRKSVENPVDRVFSEGRIVGLANHTMLVSREGCEIPIMDSGAPIRDETGEIVGAVLVFRDQSAERAAQSELKESENKFRLLVESSPDAIFVQTDKRFAFLNNTAVRLFGADSMEVLRGKPVLERMHPDSREAVRKRIHTLNGEKSTVPLLEETYLKMDGTPVPVEVSAVPARYEGKDGAIVFVRDITERKRLHEQLLQSQKMESIGRLAGGIAHDFNNLLTGIIGNLSLALDDMGEGDPLRAPLEDLGKAAESAAGLTRQLLAFSRKQIVEPKVHNVNEIIIKSQKMLHRLIGEDIELKAVLAADLGNVKVDPAQLEQVIVNLAVNSRDAMPDGGVLTLETSNVTLSEDYCATHPYTEPGNYVMIAVSDSGTGMSGEVKAHLFEPFFTTKEKGKGTGLGLSTVFGAVKQNRGSIEVYSEIGEGTTFKIYLPRVYEVTERPSRSSAEDMPGGSETIILVEDEDIVRSYAEKVLKKAGYRVYAFSNGGEALTAVQKFGEPVHLLVTDVIMPGMNGRVLARNLCSKLPGLKVLFSSGYTENVIAHHGVLYEGIAFIGKPYTPQALASKVREVLDKG
jgi:PAS domain S-box-containing protein